MSFETDGGVEKPVRAEGEGGGEVGNRGRVCCRRSGNCPVVEQEEDEIGCWIGRGGVLGEEKKRCRRSRSRSRRRDRGGVSGGDGVGIGVGAGGYSGSGLEEALAVDGSGGCLVSGSHGQDGADGADGVASRRVQDCG